MSQFAGQGNEFIHDFGSVRMFIHTPIVAGFETKVRRSKVPVDGRRVSQN
jgi:hypothetical protein